MSIAGFRATNHPQQIAKGGAVDAVDDRGTDQAFFDATAARFGSFTLDVAAAAHNAKCSDYFTVDDDGLARPWVGKVWCNPPYSDCSAWVRKAWKEWHCGEPAGADVWGVLSRSGVLRHFRGTKTYARARAAHQYGSAPVRVHEHAHGRLCTQDNGEGPWTIRRAGGHGESRLIVGMDCEMHKAQTPPELIVMLLPANRVEQGWWQDHVEPFRDRPGSPLRVEFLRGRMRFERPGWVKPKKGDRPPFGNCLLIWEPHDV